MSYPVIVILSILIGYVFGMIQTSYILGRIKGIDIRKVGSGNAGTTNTLRTLGTKAGLIVFAGDIIKCVLAVLVVRLIFAGGDVQLGRVIGLYASIGCILGHNFPFYLGFKGGKGIACTLGMMLMYWWPAALIGFALFIIIVATSHYVSVGSLLGTVLGIVLAIVFDIVGTTGMTSSLFPQALILLLIITALDFIQHRANIKRLATGTERKTYLFKKK